uniref:Uncharacterized protein n=1 Tax=Oryza punctata TaxID=4537 RepID=A0A0E0KNR0_ORYPU
MANLQGRTRPAKQSKGGRGSIRTCKKAALECEETKFEYYEPAAGDRITPKQNHKLLESQFS